MPRYRTAYPPEFRRQMVDLVRSGRTPEELARGRAARPHVGMGTTKAAGDARALADHLAR
jgi:hypothetical protein